MLGKKKEEDVSEIVSYINKLAGRVHDIERKSHDVIDEVDHKDIKLHYMTSRMNSEIKHLRKGIQSTKVVVEEQKRVIKTLVSDFKGMAKKESLKHLKEKLDAWNPQSFVTRKEAKKKISSRP